MWIIDINGEDLIITHGALDELNCHQTTREKYKVKISLCRRKSYQRKDVEEISSRFYQIRPVVSHLEVRLQEKPTTLKNISEGLKVPQRQLWKEDLSVQYDTNTNAILLSDTIQIKSLHEGTKVLHSLIDTRIKERHCSDVWKFVESHCAIGSSHIQGTTFYQYHSPVSHAVSFRINIAIASMHRLTARILDASNSFHNKNVTIHERVCPIIYTGLIYLTLMSLSMDIYFRLKFNA